MATSHHNVQPFPRVPETDPASPSGSSRAAHHVLIGIAFIAVAFVVLHLELFTGGGIRLLAAAGIGLLLVASLCLLSVYLKTNAPALIRSNSQLVTYGLLCLVPLIAARIFVLHHLSPQFVPFGIIIFIIALRHRTHTALMTALILSVFTALALRSPAAPVADPQAIALLGGAFVWSFGAIHIRKRLWLLQVGMVAAIVQTILSVAVDLVSSGLPAADVQTFVSLNGMQWFENALNGLVTGGILSAFLPIIESLFHVHTEIRLLELADLNQPLLKRLNAEAPGTYHHSLTVANMAAAAAEAVGASPLVARVGAYFHDVGKLAKPDFFVENEGAGGSRHASLSPSMSALVISSHVKDGSELARECGLPAEIIDIIHQHHGTSLMEYFYRRSIESPSGASASEDAFRYPGPKPRTMEAAIITLADAVEAASRTLPDPTQPRIQALVREVVTKKFLDGQLSDSPITLADITKIEACFSRILTATFHSRVNRIDSTPTPASKPAEHTKPAENSPT